MAVGVGMGGGVIPPALYRPKADLFAPAPVPFTKVQPIKNYLRGALIEKMVADVERLFDPRV